jgi:Ethanolamine utilization protein EutJ (predicted chaperonin)
VGVVVDIEQSTAGASVVKIEQVALSLDEGGEPFTLSLQGLLLASSGRGAVEEEAAGASVILERRSFFSP